MNRVFKERLDEMEVELFDPGILKNSSSDGLVSQSERRNERLG